ncbi:MAG TPA: hypothetical protein VHY08_21675 [Bacillota bacterium]|nr:hypothetical protein [Bacillota bacterium]
MTVKDEKWSNGMWESLGESRIPGCDPNTNVTEIGVMNNTYFAGLSTGNTYVTKGGQWSLLPDCQRIAIDQSSSGWSLFTNGLRKLNSESALPEKLLYSGGMGSFITGTNCAYSRQIGSKIFLFTQEPRYGIYNQATDSWTSGQIPDDTAPRQFASLKEGVLALTGNKVFSITSQASRLVTDLPEDAAQPSVASNTNRFWLSYLQSGAAFIQQWDNLKKSSRKCSRGGSPPAGFDPAMTIIAVPDGTRTLLCDLAGRCVAYDDATGQWTLLRQAIDGQTVYGWIKSPIIGLLLTDANGNVIVSELSATRVFSDSTQPVSPEAYIRQIKSSLKKVIRPKEGILYAQPKFRVKRVNQAAQFEFKLGTKWTRVPVSQQGFFFDHFSSLTVTPAGKIWALSQGYLLQLKLSASGKGLVPTGTWYRTNAESIRLLPNGDLRTESPDGNVIWAETDNGLQPLQSTPKPQILASGAINGETIDWVWTYSPSGNGIVQPLNRNGNNVAFTAEGRLNNQTINDIGLFKGKLLLATTGGLVVRDAKTYQYLRIERNIKPVKFIPLAGSNRLLIRCQDGTLRVWTEDNIDTMNPSLTKITLRSGDIKWQADMAPGHATDITTISASNGRQISWSHEANGWRPGCDIVNTLRRQNSGDLALCTQQGNWPFNTSSGRAASPITEPLPSDEVSFQNSALQVKADGKMVTLQPRGGGNAFVQGRLFYENANGLAGFKDAIYLLLPGRGILRRDGAHPEKITGFWLYTSSFPRGRFELGASTEGLYISTPGADPSPMSAWDVIINNDSLRLQPSKILEKPVQVKLGPITWESPTISSLNFQPYAQTKAGRQLLSNWWGTERFAWDLVHSIGVLDTGYIVAATPIGLIAWPEGENSFKKLQLLPAAGLTTITPARRRQRTLGLLAAGTSGRFLITPGDNQSPIRMAPETNPQFDCHPKVSIERRSLGGTLPCVRMIEHWDTGDPFTPGNGKVLYNTLPEFNQAELIYQGQFIFDYGILGCPVGGSFGTSNNLWVVFSANPLQNIMTLNQVQKDPKTNQYRLGLYSVTKAPYHIKSLRSYKNGFMALDADGNWWYAPVTGRIIGNWTTIPAVKNIAALRTGDQVTVDVSNLRWTKSGQLYDGMTSPPFQITPGDYPLFASDGGSIALAFDLITSLAFNRNNQHLALGTYGGIIEGPYCKNGYDMISGKNPEIRLMFNRIEQPLFIQGVAMTTPLRNVQKVRYSLEGILYTKFSANDDNNEIACLLNGDLWRKVMASEWPEEHISYTGHTIELNQQKLFIDNRPIERNNNPSSIWIPKKITDVRGWALIPNEQSLWVLDHSHGLFKVKIGPSWFLRRSLTQ